MLAKRIIPCLDVKDGRVVKGVKFLDLKEAGDPVRAAKFYSEEGADELVYLDITASFEKRRAFFEVIRHTAEEVFIPLTVGGGVRNLEDFRLLLKNGADKVSINTAAVENPSLIKEAALAFGNQCVVVAIDAKRVFSPLKNDSREGADKEARWEVYTYGGRKAAGIDVLQWVKEVAALGAGEILLTSMDKDGTKSGYDLELTKRVADEVDIPLIASGGAGNPRHLYEAFSGGKADAVLAASIFHFGEISIKQAKDYLSEKGIAIR